MAGRRAAGKKSPAEMRFAAFQSKMQLRAAKEKQLRQGLNPGSTSASQPSNYWLPLGPVPVNDSVVAPTGYGPMAGRATAIAVDQSDSTGNTVYAAGAYGGVWKSSNAAATDPTTVQWTPIMDDQPSLAVGAIALQPGNSSLILVGTGEPNYADDSYYGIGMLRSTDGGATWSTNANVSFQGQYFTLFGVGVSQIAFSTKNPNFVVAAVSGYTVGAFRLNAIQQGSTIAGLMYSSDAGASWTLAPWTDDGVHLYSSSVSSVVYNPTEDKFYAAVPYHGFYVSNGTASGGFVTFTRMSKQPGVSGALSLTACPSAGSSTCPLVRGTMSVRPVRNTGDPNQMYTWFVRDGAGDSKDDMGIWQYTGATSAWKQLSDTGIANCGDTDGCGTRQSFYNLYLSAVPNGTTGTDLYAGTVNIYKCSISASNPSCSTAPFLNLTHVYGCSSISMVHPDQHALDFLLSNPNIIYFGDDGGVNRTLLSQSQLKTGSCPTTGAKANAFDNLNTNLGSLTQFVWGAQHPTDGSTVMGGTQDNGTMGVSGSNPAPGELGWWEVNNGDGGYTQIDPKTPTNWYTEYYGVSVQSCTKGINCNADDFKLLVAEDSASNLHQVDGDESNFYMPYILDPADPTKLILGTCRVWRGPNDPAQWPNSSTANALSHNLLKGTDTACSFANKDDFISGLAAGGPSTAAGSQVIWATTSSGHIYVTTNAASGFATWTDVTGNVSPDHLQIAAVAVDPHDATGMTAIVGLQGFPSYGGRIYKTTDGGVSWWDQTDNLPAAPINDLAFDPDELNTFYAATDIGVFQSYYGSWSELGWQASGGPGYLPNVTVFHIGIYRPAGDKHLRAWTHGRGVWDIPLDNFPHGVTATPYGLTFWGKETIKSDPQITTLKNLDLVEVTLGTPSISGPDANAFAIDPATTNCGTTLASGASCNIGVTFTPTSIRTFNATVSIPTSGLRTPTVDVAVYGIGQLLGMEIDPTSASLISIMGEPSSSQWITIWNHDIVPVTISKFGFSGPDAADFTLTTGSPWCTDGQTLAVDDVCSVQVAFTAPSLGSFSGTFNVTTTSVYNPTLSVALGGTGDPAVMSIPSTLTFNSKEGVKQTQWMWVYNNSVNPVTLGPLSITGVGAAAFALDTSNGVCPSPMPGNSGCPMGFAFTPPSIGTFAATAQFTTTGAGSPNISAQLNGTGTAPDVTDFTYDFGSNPTTLTVKAGATASTQFNIHVTPTDGVLNGDVTFACSGNPSKTNCTLNPAFVAAPGTVTLTISTTAATAAKSEGGGVAWRRVLTRVMAGFALPGFVVLMLGGRARGKRKRIARLLGMTLVLTAMLALPSCGGGGGGGGTPPPPQIIPGTPAGTYTVTVSGTFWVPSTGNVTKTQQITLVVQ